MKITLNGTNLSKKSPLFGKTQIGGRCPQSPLHKGLLILMKCSLVNAIQLRYGQTLAINPKPKFHKGENFGLSEPYWVIS